MSILPPRFGAVLGLLSLVVILRGEKIVSDESQDDLYLKAVVVDYDDFVEDKLVTLCRKTLVAERQRRLTWLKIGVALSDLEEPTAEVHVTFERWRALNSSFGKRTWHRADLVALNGNAVLRIRSGNEIRKIVLEGSDPLISSV